MLERLSIKNIALIDSAEINFTKGLNVLSGETGSGKSVILESLNFVLGAKADRSLVRNGCDYCSVTAEFDVGKNDLFNDLFDEFDFERDDKLIISRKFTIDGKSSIKLNGNTVNLSMLKRFTSKLVDVHGQSEHYELLTSTNQLKLIDKIGGIKISSIIDELKRSYSEYKNILKKLDELGGDENHRLIRLDVLNYQINEIESANLQDTEEEKLLELRSQIQHREKIVSVLNSVKSAISGDGGATDILSGSSRLLSSIISLGDDFSSLSERLDATYSELDDLSDTVSGLLESFDDLDYDVDYVENRLDLIKSLKKKYGNSYLEIKDFLDKAIIEKEKLDNYEALSEKLVFEKTALENNLYKLYKELSSIRRETAVDFEKAVTLELKELGMNSAQFSVNFSSFPTFEECIFDSSNGVDNVCYMFSANKGEPLKSLSFVISGGEMSRFMLAIKAQSAKFNDISTFVFDEIDAGISGVIAHVVAEKFARIAKDVQVIAITHLPQISSMADNNLLIEKKESENNTNTYVKQLDCEEKILEVARLVGDVNSDSARKLAHELINSSNVFKKSI